jgi:DNA-binding response OmpR family regulator
MAIHRRGAGVIVTDADFPDGLSWKDLLEEVASMPAAPPVIVVSPIPGDELRLDVLGAGAFALLAEPVDASEFVRAVDLALQQSGGGRSTACAKRRRNLPRPAFQPGLEPARNAR